MLKHCANTGSRKTRKTNDDIENESTTSSSPRHHTGLDNTAYETEIEGKNSSATNKNRLTEDTMRKATARVINHKNLSFEGSSIDSGSRNKLTLNSIPEEPAKITSIDSVVDKEDGAAINVVGVTFKLVIYVLILVAAVFCALYGVAHHYIGYYPESEYLNQGDMKLIKYSTWFCSEVQLDKANVISRLVVLSKSETINPQFSYKKTEMLSMKPGDIWMRSFYLLKNSRIKIIIDSQELDVVDILGFDSEKNLDIWKNRKESMTYILKHSCCTNSDKGQFELIASSEGRHFVIIYRSNNLGSSAKLTATLDFRRTTFDFSKTERICETKAGSCNVPLKYASSQMTVVEVLNVQSDHGISIASKVNWKCNARIWFYCVVFGFVYILIILIILTIYFLEKRGLIRRCLQKCKSKRPPFYTIRYNNNSNPEGSQFSELSLDSERTLSPKKGDNNQLNPFNTADTHFYSANDDTCSCHKSYSIYSQETITSDKIVRKNETDHNNAKRLMRGNNPKPTGIAAIYRENNTPEQEVSNPKIRNYSDTRDSGIFLKYNLTDKNRNELQVSPTSEHEDEYEQNELGYPEVLLDWNRQQASKRSSLSKGSLYTESEVTSSEFSSFSSNRSEVILDWPRTGTTTLPDRYFEQTEVLGSYFPRNNIDKSNVTGTTNMGFLQVPVTDEHLSGRPDADILSEPGLKRTKSTGYFRVYSPMSHERTGAVAGRRELRSANPIFYRPMSPISFIDTETSSQTGIEV